MSLDADSFLIGMGVGLLVSSYFFNRLFHEVQKFYNERLDFWSGKESRNKEARDRK